jgi:hypothetical protein
MALPELSAWAVSHRGFRAILWNGTGDDQSMSVAAVCGQQPPGHTIEHESGDVPPNGLDVARGVCPANTTVISGGFHVATPNPDVRLDTSLEDGLHDWDIDFTTARPPRSHSPRRRYARRECAATYRRAHTENGGSRIGCPDTIRGYPRGLSPFYYNRRRDTK